MSELKALLKIEKDKEFLNKSYEHLKKKYENQYVAISDGKVVAAHRDIDRLFELLKKIKVRPSDILIEFIQPKDMLLIL